MNPYAAMCNKMLKNVFAALEEGAPKFQNPFPDVQDNKTRNGWNGLKIDKVSTQVARFLDLIFEKRIDCSKTGNT